MNSLIMIAHGVASGRRHGRSRACSAYQLMTRVDSVRAIRTEICRSTDTSVTLPGNVRRRPSSRVRFDLPRLGAMSGVLRPVGPESVQTYWVRRGLVFAAAAVLVVTLTLIITSTSSGSAAAPGPASASPTSSAAPSSSVMETAIPTQSFVSTSATRKPAAKKSPKLKASPRKTSQSTAQPCAPKELRTTLTGKRRIVAKHRTTFQLSLINGSAQTCTSRVTAKNFELKINYGDDRIWSNDDCPAMIKTISRNLGSEHTMAWSLTWDGRRSKPKCKSASQALRPGSYVATAQLKGASPVKLRMIVKAGS